MISDKTTQFIRRLTNKILVQIEITSLVVMPFLIIFTKVKINNQLLDL